MESKTFIINYLKKFIFSFLRAKVRYKFDSVARVHFVEVLPKNLYDEDKQYIAWEDNFFNEFIDNYPDQNLCFITEGSAVSIDEPVDLELKGDGFFSSYNFENRIINLVKDVKTSPCATNSFRGYSTISRTEIHQYPDLEQDSISEFSIQRDTFSFKLAA